MESFLETGVKTGVINSWDKGNGEKYTDVCMAWGTVAIWGTAVMFF